MTSSIVLQHHLLLPWHVHNASVELLGVDHRLLELQVPRRQRHNGQRLQRALLRDRQADGSTTHFSVLLGEDDN
jgi:hypothetical protein